MRREPSLRRLLDRDDRRSHVADHRPRPSKMPRRPSPRAAFASSPRRRPGFPGLGPRTAPRRRQPRQRGVVLVHGGRARERALRRRAPGARPAQGRPRRADPAEQRRLRPLLPRRHPRGHRPGADLPAARRSGSSRATSTTRATSSPRAARARSSRRAKIKRLLGTVQAACPALEQVVAVEGIRESMRAAQAREDRRSTTSPSSSSRAARPRAPRA